MSVRLCINQSSLRRTDKGTVYGQVWFETEGAAFPARDWSDLAPAFIRSWIEALVNLATGSSNAESASFMDGPYSVEISVRQTGRLDMLFLRNENGRDVKHSTHADLGTTLQNGMRAGEQVLHEYRARGWTDRDEVAIRETVLQGPFATLRGRKPGNQG